MMWKNICSRALVCFYIEEMFQVSCSPCTSTCSDHTWYCALRYANCVLTRWNWQKANNVTRNGFSVWVAENTTYRIAIAGRGSNAHARRGYPLKHNHINIEKHQAEDFIITHAAGEAWADGVKDAVITVTLSVIHGLALRGCTLGNKETPEWT